MRKHLLNVIGIFAAVAIFMFGFEQLQEILASWRGTDWLLPHTIVWGLHTTNGATYDLSFILMFLGMMLLFASIWLWNDEPKKESK